MRVFIFSVLFGLSCMGSAHAEQMAFYCMALITPVDRQSEDANEIQHTDAFEYDCPQDSLAAASFCASELEADFSSEVRASMPSGYLLEYASCYGYAKIRDAARARNDSVASVGRDSDEVIKSESDFEGY